jgi:hypothetical protein
MIDDTCPGARAKASASIDLSPTWRRMGWMSPPTLALFTSSEWAMASRAKSSGLAVTSA